MRSLSEWRYDPEDAFALQVWANDAVAKEVLARWSMSDNATLSMTAVSLVNNQHASSLLDLEALRGRFNLQLAGMAVPADGIDAALRRADAWCTAVFPALADGSGE